jgi:hypothetical protein
MLQNNTKIFNIFRKKINDLSLKYSANSLKNCCVLTILNE